MQTFLLTVSVFLDFVIIFFLLTALKMLTKTIDALAISPSQTHPISGRALMEPGVRGGLDWDGSGRPPWDPESEELS